MNCWGRFYKFSVPNQRTSFYHLFLEFIDFCFCLTRVFLFPFIFLTFLFLQSLSPPLRLWPVYSYCSSEYKWTMHTDSDKLPGFECTRYEKCLLFWDRYYKRLHFNWCEAYYIWICMTCNLHISYSADICRNSFLSVRFCKVTFWYDQPTCLCNKFIVLTGCRVCQYAERNLKGSDDGV
jgi:hypothetical protein